MTGEAKLWEMAIHVGRQVLTAVQYKEGAGAAMQRGFAG